MTATSHETTEYAGERTWAGTTVPWQAIPSARPSPSLLDDLHQSIYCGSVLGSAYGSSEGPVADGGVVVLMGREHACLLRPTLQSESAPLRDAMANPKAFAKEIYRLVRTLNERHHLDAPKERAGEAAEAG